MIIVVILLKQYCILERSTARAWFSYSWVQREDKIVFIQMMLKRNDRNFSWKKPRAFELWQGMACSCVTPSCEGEKLATINKYFSCKVLIPTWCDAKLCVADGFTHAAGTKSLCFWRSAAVKEKNICFIFFWVRYLWGVKERFLGCYAVQHHSKAIQ